MSSNARKTVVNPYAKKEKPSGPISASATASDSRTVLIESTSSSSYGRRSDQNTLPKRRIQSEVEYTSFSQAFDHVEETVNSIPSPSTNIHSIDTNSNSNTITRTSEELTLQQPHVLHVSTKQRGNGILRYIRNVPYAYSKITPDYILGTNRCALFISFKYHNLHPNYVHRRIAELKSDFDLRILLCLVDVEDNASILCFLNKLCVINNMTLVLAWSEEEAARYLETFKAFEGKDASSIQKKKEVTFDEQVRDVLSCVRSVNKSDAAQLLEQFGSLRKIARASMDELRLCPGVGEKKVRRLYEAFHKPFSSAMAKERKKLRKEEEGKHLDVDLNINVIADPSDVKDKT